MNFEIIKNSESFSGFDIPDNEYKGQAPGLVHGWSFEFINENGDYAYNSVYYSHGTPEDNAQERFDFEMERMNGWTPTGRVVFRGYAKEYYDPDERDWFVRDVPESDIPNGSVYVRPHARNGKHVRGHWRKR